MQATNTLRICNNYCFSTTTMVARTLLNVTLCVHCLSCSVMFGCPTFYSTDTKRFTSSRVYSINSFIMYGISAQFNKHVVLYYSYIMDPIRQNTLHEFKSFETNSHFITFLPRRNTFRRIAFPVAKAVHAALKCVHQRRVTEVMVSVLVELIMMAVGTTNMIAVQRIF